MKNCVGDWLLPDFIEDIFRIWSKAHVNNVLKEPITPELIHCQQLRPGDSFIFYSLPLYVVTRLKKPHLVVETGTQNGSSAQAILAGLNKNQYGILASFDSGHVSSDGTHVDTVGYPGDGITEKFKRYWNLTIGLTKDTLDSTLAFLTGNGKVSVDLFFHDSDHGKENVEFEFKTILKYSGFHSFLGLHDHYDQWDTGILENCVQIVGMKHPNVHHDEHLDGVYHNVLRLWRKQ